MKCAREFHLATVVLLVFSLGIVSPLIAGGPLHIFPLPGDILKWDARTPVNFTIDQGPLGTRFDSPDQAAQFVRDAAQAWTDVPSATVSFRDNGFLPMDITVDNYESFFGFGQPNELERPENPIIFDNDGQITDDLLGQGSSNFVLGFAGIRSIEFDEAEEQAWARSAWAVLNGELATATASFRHVFVHELGHLLGLDHSQGLPENFAQNTQACPGGSPCGLLVPLMHPIRPTRAPEGPIEDDVAWISWIYPESDFSQTTGTISGRVLRRSGAPLQGANVVAVSAIPNGDGTYSQSRAGVISVVSDFLMLDTGEFLLPGIEPGDYFVFAEPINSGFTGGSGVGPFEFRPTNFPRDYHDVGESADEDPTEKTLVHVEAGQTAMGVEIIANEPANQLGLLGDDDEMLFQFSALSTGFRFPFYGKIYEEVFVNSDGNLTFEIGDGKPGIERGETRFLDGPPRIAPLFTDMDPSVSGEIIATSGDGWIKFAWDRVPEFSDPGPAAANEFSVTLYSNGDIVFDYGQIVVTPDPSEDFPQGLQAVVGVTPGASTSGSSEDVSAGNLEFDLGSAPIFQVFPGSSFDLDGLQIRFNAEEVEYSELLFPFLQGNSSEFTGFALTNFAEDVEDNVNDATLSIEGRGDDGQLSDYEVNPAAANIAAQTQLAKLGYEFFKVPLSEPREGWIRMLSTQPELASFFMFGNGLDGPTTKMDGAVAFKEPSTTLYFTRIYQGQAVFPSLAGPKDATTHLSIVNPNEEEIQIQATLYEPGPSGGFEREQVTRQIPANGRIYENIIELFDMVNTERVLDGWVEVETSGAGAIGFALIQLEDTAIGLNAQTPSNATTSYSAQLGHAVNLFTSLKLANTTDDDITVNVTLVMQDESLGSRFAQFTLFRKSTFQNDIGSWFGLPLPTDPIVGSIKVEATAPGIEGDVLFGDRNSVRNAAALPLQSQLFTLALHSQVANGKDPSDPSKSQFTGLALFNPNNADAEVVVEVYDRNGVLVGDPAVVDLGPAGRISNTLVELVPESAGLVRGYIIIKSDLPIVGQELFGNSGLDYLAAVPPAIIE